MQTTLGLGLRLIDTWIGVKYNEVNHFDQSEMKRVNAFMAWYARASETRDRCCMTLESALLPGAGSRLVVIIRNHRYYR